MSDDINIPPKALEAAARALREFYSDEPVSVCDGVSYKAARAACLAMLKARPGMHEVDHRVTDKNEVVSFSVVLPIILPLPQENIND